MKRKFPLAQQALRDALEYLERSHYSIKPPGSVITCRGCLKAIAIRKELEALKGLDHVPS